MVYNSSKLEWWRLFNSLHHSNFEEWQQCCNSTSRANKLYPVPVKQPSRIRVNDWDGTTKSYGIILAIQNITNYIDGLAQDCSNYNVLAMELLQSCTTPSIYITYGTNCNCCWCALAELQHYRQACVVMIGPVSPDDLYQEGMREVICQACRMENVMREGMPGEPPTG